jgi:hypothetical protein
MAVKFLKTNDPAKSPDFAPNDFNDLRRGRETAGFAQRNDSFRFHVFPAWPFEAASRSAPSGGQRIGESKMAPQALEKAQFGIANGAREAGARRRLPVASRQDATGAFRPAI